MTERVPGIRTLRHDPDERPFIVIWEVTRACELVCTHCRADAIPRRHPLELTTAEGHRLLDQLASGGPPRPLVVLTGGDPFERPDLESLVAHGTERGLNMSLAPSVTPRLTRQRLRALRDAGAKAVSLSLDGASAASHDGFRGVDGVFDTTLAAAATIRELGLRLQVNSTVTRRTVTDLPEILRHAIAMDAALWSVFFLVPTGRGEQLDPLDADETEDVLHWLVDVSRSIAIKTTEAPHFRRVAIQRRAAAAAMGPTPAPAHPTGALHARLRRACPDLVTSGAEPQRRAARPPLDVNAGKGFVFVDHVGALYPSGFLPIPVGSVRERPITELYRTATLLRRLRQPATFGGRCGRCEYRNVCGGSRSRAYAATGDPYAEEPTCNHHPSGEPVPSVPP